MEERCLQIGTVFSGIGAFEQALLKKGIPFNILFACDNGEIELKQTYEELKNEYESQKKISPNLNIQNFIKRKYELTKKTNNMQKSYFANYDITDDKWYDDIRFLDGLQFHNKIDIFVGGSPCQSFSVMGRRKGLEDARGTLFYDYARLVKEIQPKVFIYENVPGMLNLNHGDTWERIKNIFEELNYDIHYSVLNSKDFGIPQDRKRLFVVGFKKKTKFVFPKVQPLKVTAFDFLEENVDPCHYLGQKGFEFVTKNTTRAKINSKIIRTQKANQQFNWNGDFIFEEFDKIKNNKEVMERAYIGTWQGKRGVVRQLSYRECYRLMGFSDTYDYSHVNNVWRYRQAGNSIVVNVLEALLDQIFKVVDFSE